MAEKRRVSTRTRGERPAKKRIQASARELSESSQQHEPPSEPIATKVTDAKPLPTIDAAAPAAGWSSQSVLKSGVLAASLSRSRNAWVTENIFERYWTKPTKKKGPEELVNNPPKESMQKIGHCRLTIEPNVFDVTLFAIRKWPPQSAPAAGKTVSQPTPSSVVPADHATPSMPSTGTVGGNTSSVKPPVLTPAPFPNVTPPSQTQPAAPANVASSTPQQAPTVPAMGAGSASSILTPLPMNATSIPMAPPQQLQTKPSQDPVIQMLAQRASTNPELKVLMKIVASGSATGEQLRVFQAHIDDLTAILHRQKQMAYATSSSVFPTARPLSNTTLNPPAPHYYPPAPPPKPKPTPHPKPDPTTGVALEFTGASTDRFLFPKHSILEFAPTGRQVLASFLVVRRPLASSTLDPTLEYHQPVTLRLNADSPRIFEALAKTIAPYDDARRHMENVMRRTTRAPDVRLVLQLPAESESADGEADGQQALSKAARQRAEDAEGNCVCCFAPVTGHVKGDGQTQAVCQACTALLQANSLKGLGRKSREFAGGAGLEMPVRLASGPMTLMLAPRLF